MIHYTAPLLNKTEKELYDRIGFVGDRPANDKHYSINSTKLKNELGWKPCVDIEKGFELTVKHYIDLYSRR
jgi:dTDP-glucose 4,6-dehydratase